jgi:hypothetical protein
MNSGDFTQSARRATDGDDDDRINAMSTKKCVYLEKVSLNDGVKRRNRHELRDGGANVHGYVHGFARRREDLVLGRDSVKSTS